MAETKISAYISDTTKELVEQYVQVHGVKKGDLLEEALLHPLLALRELPADLVIPSHVVVHTKSFEQMTHVIKKPRKPTKAMQELMAGNKKVR